MTQAHYHYRAMGDRNQHLFMYDTSVSSRRTLWGNNSRNDLHMPSINRIQTPADSYNLDEVDYLPIDVKYIDTHCHLDFLFQRIGFKDMYSVYRSQNAKGFPTSYEGCVAIFCDPDTFETNIWRRFLVEDKVWACLGCHPNSVDKLTFTKQCAMCHALDEEKVVALGEIGLDYSHKNNTDHALQKLAFELQLDWAVKKNKAVVIHTRDASEDTMSIMRKMLPRDHKIHLHCFSGDWEEAQEWMLEFSNLKIGLTGLVTYPSAVKTHQVAKHIPMDKLLLETDAPFFVPRLESNISTYSHPGMAVHVAAKVAALRGTSLEAVLKKTRRNTFELYNI